MRKGASGRGFLKPSERLFRHGCHSDQGRKDVSNGVEMRNTLNSFHDIYTIEMDRGRLGGLLLGILAPLGLSIGLLLRLPILRKRLDKIS